MEIGVDVTLTVDDQTRAYATVDVRLAELQKLCVVPSSLLYCILSLLSWYELDQYDYW